MKTKAFAVTMPLHAELKRDVCYFCGKETETFCEDCGQPVCAEHSTSCDYCGKRVCLNCDY